MGSGRYSYLRDLYSYVVVSHFWLTAILKTFFRDCKGKMHHIFVDGV